MTVQQIKTQLENNIDFLKQRKQELWDNQDKAIKIYGSKRNWNAGNDRTSASIQSLTNFLEWIEQNDDSDLEDTYDSMDGGLNDLDVSMFQED